MINCSDCSSFIRVVELENGAMFFNRSVLISLSNVDLGRVRAVCSEMVKISFLEDSWKIRREIAFKALVEEIESVDSYSITNNISSKVMLKMLLRNCNLKEWLCYNNNIYVIDIIDRLYEVIKMGGVISPLVIHILREISEIENQEVRGYFFSKLLRFSEPAILRGEVDFNLKRFTIGIVAKLKTKEDCALFRRKVEDEYKLANYCFANFEANSVFSVYDSCLPWVMFSNKKCLRRKEKR